MSQALKIANASTIRSDYQGNEFQEKLGIIGKSEAMRKIMHSVEQVAPIDISVLITGDSGTGKELIAKAVHVRSRRRHESLVTVNCGAIPEGIIESELFGHEKGSFTGAIGPRKGYFELADKGTIFLDEIGELPLGTQVKLLRVLESHEFMRVGGTQTLRVDVRILAATNKNLEAEVRKGEFREDLFFRLNAINIWVPPLRERKEDILLLVNKFAVDFCRTNHIEFEGFTEDAQKILENHYWPGNVRELRNLVESVIVLEQGRKVDTATLRRHLRTHEPMDQYLPVPVNKNPEQVERELLLRALLEMKSEIAQLRQLLLDRFYQPQRLKPWQLEEVEEISEKIPKENIERKKTATVAEMEKELIRSTLERLSGSKRKTAKSLGLSERTLYRKLKRYGIQT